MFFALHEIIYISVPSKALCQGKLAMTSSHKESPVGSKYHLKFLTEPWLLFETVTWLLVWVTGLQNTDFKGIKAWASVQLVVQVAAHQSSENHWLFSESCHQGYRILWWNCRSTYNWLASANLIFSNISSLITFRLQQWNSLQLILQFSYPDAQGTLTFLPIDVLFLQWKLEYRKWRKRENDIQLQLIPS